MLPLLVVLFIAVPIAELAVIVQVGEAIGILPTIALLLADSLLGSVVMRSQGRLAWRRFNAALAEGRPPAREVLDGALIILGGALLLTPGFISDVVGLAFLLPPSRALLRRLLVRRLERRMVAAVTGGDGPWRPRRGGRAYDVDGTAVDLEPDSLDRSR